MRQAIGDRHNLVRRVAAGGLANQVRTGKRGVADLLELLADPELGTIDGYERWASWGYVYEATYQLVSSSWLPAARTPDEIDPIADGASDEF
jgi:hypothetical protein